MVVRAGFKQIWLISSKPPTNQRKFTLSIEAACV